MKQHANAENILSQSLRFLLEREDAEALLNDMEKRIKTTWYQVARSVGVSESDCKLISGAFAYPGFRLTPQTTAMLLGLGTRVYQNPATIF